MAVPRADRITFKIDAEVTEAVNKIKYVQDAYLRTAAKSKQAFADAAKAMDQFSGFKIIREATAAARAVEKIGGVAKLTAKEQENLNKVVTEAIAKYTALGGKVPPILQKIADATKKIDDQTRLVQASMEKISGGKITAEANAMVTAVTKLGGATKLTATEQEKVNKLLSEAIAKYTALGQTAPAAMTKLWQETKKVDDQTKAVQATMAKFSGSKMIQDANNAVAAVNKLGGATKLTSKEQQALNAQLGEAIAKYKALGQSAPAELNRMWLATKQIGEETKRSGDFFNRAFFRLTGAITLADLAAQGIIKTFGLLWDGVKKAGEAIAYLAVQGSKVEMISEGFFRLQNSMEQMGSKTMDQLRRGTQGMVSDFNLMEAANRAMLFGLNLTGDSWEKLAEGALRLGRAMGVDVKKSFDDLVLALGRVSPRILDNLGIIVKVGEANQKWADAHGKTVRAMSGSERVLAFQELALEKILNHVKGLGEFTYTLADRMQQLNVKWDNFVNLLAQTLNKSPVLREMFLRIAESIELIFGASGQGTVNAFTELIEDLAITLVDLGASFISLAQIVYNTANQVTLAWKSVLVIFDNLNLALTKYRLVLAEFDLYMSKGGNKEYIAGLQKELTLRREQHDQQLKVTRAREADVVVTSMQLERQTAINGILDRAQLVLTEIGNRMRAQKGTTTDWSNTMDGAITKLKELIEAGEDATGEAMDKQLEKLIKDTTALTAALTAAEASGADTATVLKQYGAAIESVTRRTEVFGRVAVPIIDRWHDKMEARRPWREKFIKDLRDLEEKLSDMPEDIPFSVAMEAFGSQLEKFVPLAIAAKIPIPPLIAQWYAMKTAAEETADQLKAFDEKMKDLAETHEAYEKKLDDMRGIRDKNKLAALKVGKPQGDERLAVAFEEMQQEMAKLEPFSDTMTQEMKTTWMEAASAIGQKYTAVAEDIKVKWSDAFGELTKRLGKPILDLFSDRKTFEEKFNGITGAIGSSFAPKITGMFENVFGGKADASGVRSGGLAAGGGILGAFSKGVFKALPYIGPLIGQLAGPIAAGIKQIFTGPSMEKKVAADLGREYGQKFSEGLNQAIADDAKRLGDRVAASLLHIKKLADEAGGITVSNANKWIAKTRDIFVVLGQGIISTEEAAKSLNDMIPDLAATFEKSGGIWNAQFQELIDLTKEAGLEVEALNKLIDEQLTKMSGGTTKVVSGFTAPLLKLIEAAEEANSKLEGGLLGEEGEDAFKKGGRYVAGLQKEIENTEASIADLKAKGKDLTKSQAQNLKDLTDKLKTLKHEYAGLSQTQKDAATKLEQGAKDAQIEFDRLSRIVLRTFNTMVAEGKSPLEAIDSIGSSIDDMKKVADKLGLSGSEAFKQLARFRELTEINRPVIESLDGLNQILIASINLKTLDQEAFEDLEAQGLSSYQKLIAAGFTEKEALMQIAPLLGTIIEAHEKRGIAIDAETAKLIAAADQEGLLKEKQISTNEILMEGLSAIILAVGGTLPEAWRKAADAAVEANKKATGATVKTEAELTDLERQLARQGAYWHDWAGKAEAAAGDVEAAVDGVTMGHSPGGMKEWEPMLKKSRKAMLEFARDGKRGLEDMDRLLRNVPELTVSSRHMGAVMARYEHMAGRTPTTSGAVVLNGDVNISTWTVNDQRDLIRKTITPEVLKTVHDGGDPGRNFKKLVRGSARR